MRWADLDMLGHVNNVVYADYLQEARVDMLRVHARSPHTDGLAEGLLVANHQITYLEPLHFDHHPVFVDVWVTEIRAASFTLAYEVYREHSSDHGDQRTVYLRASTLLTPYVFEHRAPRRISRDEREALSVYLHPEDVLHPHGVEVSEARHLELGHYPIKVRFSDVDVYGHVNNVKYFEYFQESRIAVMAKVAEAFGLDERPSVVVAQAEVTYRAPISLRPAPYDIYTWVARFGSTSMVFDSEIVDNDVDRASGAKPVVLSRSRIVLVSFDVASGRPVAPPARFRAALESLGHD
ncbi:thioesterase family protein [Nocardioides sp. BP30]|uniref:acyl-CoA thioesterase n=1 Tax=Nocardioides sp. BP30 TaxID=3036374 RepID=UPI002468556E|nr:thioesterase family protein [Nocardioides sp. BP30]WGL51566.1 thioesterase family protein [Nocardioides sp. BP30]